jgi:hypothetical protein
VNITSISTLLTSKQKEAIGKMACLQQTARVIMTNMNRRRRKKGHYRIQPGTRDCPTVSLPR